MESLAPACATFSVGSCRAGCSMSIVVLILLLVFLDQHQIVIVQFGNLGYQLVLLYVILLKPILNLSLVMILALTFEVGCETILI